MSGFSYGFTVTRRAKSVKQPRGGYLKPKSFVPVSLGEGLDELNPVENVHASLVGMSVDYLSRFLSGTRLEEAFKPSLKGSVVSHHAEEADRLLRGVTGLDDASITNAVKLTGFDVCFRAGLQQYKPVEEIQPDTSTIENIRVMVNRTLHFLDVYGPKILDGFTFEGGYSDVIVNGDGDFLTADTLWDLKVSKNPIKKEHTLQLLMYWRMGLRSVYPEFRDVRYLGIYNPSNLRRRTITVARSIRSAECSGAVSRCVVENVGPGPYWQGTGANIMGFGCGRTVCESLHEPAHSARNASCRRVSESSSGWNEIPI